VLVEELLGDGTGIPLDYKLFVFHGRVRLIQVDSDRFQGHRRSLYTPSWERLPGRFQKYELTPDVERPPRLAEMVEIAETLATETDFVRVDLYAIGERIVFGELTNYPEAGNAPLVPAAFDREVGGVVDAAEAICRFEGSAQPTPALASDDAGRRGRSVPVRGGRRHRGLGRRRRVLPSGLALDHARPLLTRRLGAPVARLGRSRPARAPHRRRVRSAGRLDRPLGDLVVGPH
jgi:hypothetical protein